MCLTLMIHMYSLLLHLGRSARYCDERVCMSVCRPRPVRISHMWWAAKNPGLCAFGGGVVSPSNTMSHGPRFTSLPGNILIHWAVWPQQTWAENCKRGSVPLWGGGAGSPSDSMWSGPRPIFMSSFFLIHPTVWPQYSNDGYRETDKQDTQDRETRQTTVW